MFQNLDMGENISFVLAAQYPPVDAGPMITQRGSTEDSLKDSEIKNIFSQGLYVTDPSGGCDTVTVALMGKLLPGDQVKVADAAGLAGISDHYDSATGTYTCENLLTVPQVNLLLANLAFIPQADANSREVMFYVTITDLDGLSVSSGVVKTLSITHDPMQDVTLNFSDTTMPQTVNLTGSESRNIVGGSGDDIFRGNGGNNAIDGGSGNNQLWGAGGDDQLMGGSGSNCFWWAQNNGHDRVYQAGNNSGDALYFSNITRGSYTLGRQTDDLVLTIADGSSLTLSDWYGMDAKARIQGWVFGRSVVAWNDGEEAVIDLSKPCYKANGLHEVIGASSGNSILRGSSSDDIMIAGSGGSQMWGAAGSDTMTGGSGQDTYWWGRTDGQDVITGRSDNSQDALMLYNTPLSSIHSQLSGNDLVISLDGSSDTLTLQDWAKGGGYQLNSFNIGGKMYQVAADGQNWSAK
ncbi:MAG: calcium-binding protein [Sporomusaceae bacterium]|nr:calcium-binding protein [Sporomusaceae bacterium]